MFLETAPRLEKLSRAWAAQTLQDLRTVNPRLYEEAEEIKERIVSGTVVSGKTRKRIGDAGIT